MTAVIPLPIRPFADSTDSLLRFAMRLDATLSGLAGLMIAVAADPISSLTGLSSITEYGLGAFFVFCGLIVFGLAAAPDLRRAGIGVAIANIVFTVAAVGVVAADALPLTATGIGATLASGVYTALIGYLQYLGVRRLPA
jgi:GNAT superfamily N-acetyltransferase